MTAPLLVDGRAWRIEHRTFMDGRVCRRLRLVGFANGWVASADSSDGPTLAADRSPFLAAWRALEPMGIGLPEAMGIVGTLQRLGGRASLPQSAA